MKKYFCQKHVWLLLMVLFVANANAGTSENLFRSLAPNPENEVVQLEESKHEEEKANLVQEELDCQLEAKMEQSEADSESLPVFDEDPSEHSKCGKIGNFCRTIRSKVWQGTTKCLQQIPRIIHCLERPIQYGFRTLDQCIDFVSPVAQSALNAKIAEQLLDFKMVKKVYLPTYLLMSKLNLSRTQKYLGYFVGFGKELKVLSEIRAPLLQLMQILIHQSNRIHLAVYGGPDEYYSAILDHKPLKIKPWKWHVVEEFIETLNQFMNEHGAELFQQTELLAGLSEKSFRLNIGALAAGVELSYPEFVTFWRQLGVTLGEIKGLLDYSRAKLNSQQILTTLSESPKEVAEKFLSVAGASITLEKNLDQFLFWTALRTLFVAPKEGNYRPQDFFDLAKLPELKPSLLKREDQFSSLQASLANTLFSSDSVVSNYAGVKGPLKGAVLVFVGQAGGNTIFSALRKLSVYKTILEIDSLNEIAAENENLHQLNFPKLSDHLRAELMNKASNLYDPWLNIVDTAFVPSARNLPKVISANPRHEFSVRDNFDNLANKKWNENEESSESKGEEDFKSKADLDRASSLDGFMNPIARLGHGAPVKSPEKLMELPLKGPEHVSIGQRHLFKLLKEILLNYRSEFEGAK